MMKRFFYIVCLVLCLVVGLRELSAQALPFAPWHWVQSVAVLGEASPALQALVGRGGNSALVREVLLEARDMRNRGLPTEPFLLKANEGWAKREEPRAIQSALKRTRAQTVQAARWVDAAIVQGAGVASPRERLQAIQIYQSVLASGIPPEALSKMEWKQESLRSLQQRARDWMKKKPREADAVVPIPPPMKGSASHGAKPSGASAPKSVKKEKVVNKNNLNFHEDKKGTSKKDLNQGKPKKTHGKSPGKKK